MRYLLLLSVAFLSFGCVKVKVDVVDGPVTPPSPLASISTKTVRMIAPAQAECNGYVTYNNSPAVTEWGFVWATHPNPTIGDNKKVTPLGLRLFNFTDTITNLPSLGTLFVRAFATNPNGTVYGEERTINAGQLPFWQTMIRPLSDVQVICGNGNDLYVADPYVRRSTDSGATWSVVKLDPATDMAADAFTATGTHLFATYTDGKLWVSHNNGSTWTQAPLTPRPGGGRMLWSQGNRVFVVRDGFAHVSTDYGQTFASTTFPSGAPSKIRKGVNALYAVVETQIDRSYDNGATWLP